MRYFPRPSLCAFALLLALVVPSLVVVEAARSNAAPHAEGVSSGDAGKRTASSSPAEPDGARAARARENYGRLPLSFEPNRGQADARVRFLARNSAYSLYLTADEMVFALRAASASSALRIKLLGASREPRAYGLEGLEGRSNYLVGSDPKGWHTDVPNFAKVKYEGVYPGVDVVYYGTRRQLEYDFRLAPGADAGLIRLGVEGARGFRIDADGDLVLPTAAGEVRQHAPRAYQEVEGGRREVACRYARRGAARVGFELGAYDRSLPLVIDPVFVFYSTYLGGGGYDEANAVAVDAQGNVYVTGKTSSYDFPVTPGAFQQSRRGGAPQQQVYDAFVAKLNAEGTALVYSTFLGGGGDDDFATSIAVDAAGQAHVAGETNSTDFPTTPGAFRSTASGNQDVFVSKLDASGSSLLYSTYLGGGNFDGDAHVALGGGGAVYVGGVTASGDYPVTPGAFQTQYGGIPLIATEGFVTKLSPTPGAGLLFSTFLGGSGAEMLEGLAVAAGLDDSVYVTGYTVSTDFPTTPNALQPAIVGDGFSPDAFVARLNASGTGLVYSTFLGGENEDSGTSVAVGADGAAYVAGYTHSESFPTTPGAFRTSFGNPGAANNSDAFVAKLGADGASLAYSTYFGGSGYDRTGAVAIDAQGNAYVVGHTNSTDLPVTPDAQQAAYGGGYFDGFLFALNGAGTAVSYATYLGGSDRDEARGVALDANGGAYLTGLTYSYDFSTTPTALQSFRGQGAGSDCFVTKLFPPPPSFTVSGRVTNRFGYGLRDAIVNVTGTVQTAVSTDADGFYTVTGLPPGADITLSAHRGEFSSFVPVDGRIQNLSRNETLNFTGDAPVLISGRVTDENGAGHYAQLVLTSGDGSTQVAYSSFHDGSYGFYVPAGGTYTVTPGPDLVYAFTPQSHTFGGLIGDVTLDFLAQRRPNIYGNFRDEVYGYNLGYMKVTLTSPSLPQPVERVLDGSGWFEFENLERGATYTLTPADPNSNRTFTPAEITVPDIQSDQFVTFTVRPIVSIHGHVGDANGNPVTGVVKLTGAVNAEAETDSAGFFDFVDLPRGGDYTVTVTKPGSLYTFAPPSQTFKDLQEVQFLQVEALPPLRIMGIVRNPSASQGVPATVTLSGTVNATVQADEWGSYEFNDLPRGGDYTVTPSYQLYTFTPPSRGVTNIQADQLFTFDALPPLRIQGALTDGEGGWVAGATVRLSGAVNATATTDEWGGYAFENLPRGGSYTVTPTHDLYNFTPPSREFAQMGEDQLAFFNGARRTFTLGGRVADAGGAPLPGVTLTLGGSLAAVTQTDAQGNYAFANLSVGRPYAVTAARPGYAFAPATFNVADPRGDTSANFNASHLTYTIGGHITDHEGGGTPLAGATVTLGGSLAATTQTDAQGNYAFTGLPSEGNYTVIATKQHYFLDPEPRAFNNLLADATADFEGWRVHYQLSGRVTDGAGGGVGGVTVTLGGAAEATALTDSAGRYVFPALAYGFAYTLTAAKAHYTFSPPTRQLDSLDGDTTTADFAATLLRHRISGRVSDAQGGGFAGATVQLIGGPGGVVTTDANGNYAFNSLPAGDSYTVQPARQFYSFSPARAVFDDLGADQTANFTATLDTFSVGGRVTEGAGGVAGVTVNLGGTRTAATQTDAQGNYLFTQLPANGTYTVTPAAGAVYAFSPGGASFNTLPSNQTANFAATRLNYQVGGYALDACGRALPGVTLSLARAGGATATAQTDAAGFYSFAGVQAGYNYTLAPTDSAYTFTPAAVPFDGLSANQAANFTGRPPTTTTDVLPLADLYVRAGNNAGSNFGTATQLIARVASQAKDTYESYLKFNVGQPCTVTTVRLRLYGQLSSAGTLPVAVYGVPLTTWTETGTNWNNKPAAGALLRTVSIPGTTAAWYEWDVTDYVRSELAAGRTTVAFALKSTTTTSYQVTFNSREATGANAPRLAVTTP